MSAITSIIFVGNPHPNDGGIRPFETIYLEEGSRPCFSLQKVTGRFIFIPTLEKMLDDLLFMIAFRVIKDSIILDVFHEYFRNLQDDSDYIQMYENFSSEARSNIYLSMRSINSFPKVTICLFNGSELSNTVENIKDYDIDFEICVPKMGKEYSSWSHTREFWYK